MKAADKPCQGCGGVRDRHGLALCRVCYRIYWNTYARTRYNQRRAWGVEKLGGACVDCGSTSNLHVSYAGSKSGGFSIRQMWMRNMQDLARDLEFCQLFCRSCWHKREIAKRQNHPHGMGLTGRKGCYCPYCGPLKREYKRQWRARR